MRECAKHFRDPYPTTIGKYQIDRVVDWNTCFDSKNAMSLTKQSNFMIQFEIQDSCTAWITIRASGTEPKMKYYIESTNHEVAMALEAAIVSRIQKSCVQ